MIHLLAVAYGLGLVVAACSVFYVFGIWADRWFYTGILTDKEYAEHLQHLGLSSRTASGGLAAFLTVAVVFLLWYIGTALLGSLR